jgi:heme exporter protein D
MRAFQSSGNRLLTAAGLALALALLPLTVSQASDLPSTAHDVVFLIDNSQSVRTGEGAPDRQPTDPKQVRLRLPRLVIQVLSLDPASANRRAGVVSFAGDTETLIPLTSIPYWSMVDLTKIRATDQRGTNFSTALDAACEMLPADCSPDVHRCDVVVITDGVFERYRVRQHQRATERTLQRLRSLGASVHLLTFEEGDEKWREFLADGLVATYQPAITALSSHQMCAVALRSLGVEALLAGLTPVQVAGEEIVTLTVPGFRTWVSYQVLADSPLTVTFLYAGQVVPPITTGAEYTLFQPQAGRWRMQLQGDGLAYYRQSGEGIADLSLYLHAPGKTVALGEDVTVRAGVTAGGASVADLASFTVTGTIDGAGVTRPLKLDLDETDGSFAAVAPAAWFKSGIHTVTLVARSTIPGLVVRPATGQFQVVAPPTLELTTASTEPIRPGQSMCVTVTVGNWKPGYTPELQFYGPGAANVIQSPWSTPEAGVFVSTITTTTGAESSLAIVAQLVAEAGNSEDGLFDTIQTAPKLVAFTTAPAAWHSSCLLVPLSLSALLFLLVVGVHAWRRFYDPVKRKRQRLRRIRRLRDEAETLARIVDGALEESTAVAGQSSDVSILPPA